MLRWELFLFDTFCWATFPSLGLHKLKFKASLYAPYKFSHRVLPEEVQTCSRDGAPWLSVSPWHINSDLNEGSVVPLEQRYFNRCAVFISGCLELGYLLHLATHSLHVWGKRSIMLECWSVWEKRFTVLEIWSSRGKIQSSSLQRCHVDSGGWELISRWAGREVDSKGRRLSMVLAHILHKPWVDERTLAFYPNEWNGMSCYGSVNLFSGWHWARKLALISEKGKKDETKVKSQLCSKWVR